MKRFRSIDMARAYAVLMIVLGHILRQGELRKWLYSFHVPLCLIVSGICFSKKRTFTEHIRSRFFRLMVPYYIFSVGSIVIYVLFAEKLEGMETRAVEAQGILSYFWGMLYGNVENDLMRWNTPLWYIPMLFAMETLAYAVLPGKSAPRSDAVAVLASVVCASALYYGVQDLNLPFGLETVVFLFPFFAIGRFLSSWVDKLESGHKPILFAVGAALLLIGTLLKLQCPTVNYAEDRYNNYYMFIAVAVMLSLAVLCLSGAWSCRVIEIVGQNTLPILLMHKFAVLFFDYVFPPTRALKRMWFLPGSLVNLALTAALCLAVAALIRRMAPWMLGLPRDARPKGHILR